MDLESSSGDLDRWAHRPAERVEKTEPGIIPPSRVDDERMHPESMAAPTVHDLLERAAQAREWIIRFFGRTSKKESEKIVESLHFSERSVEYMQIREAARCAENIQTLLRSVAEEKFRSLQGGIPDAALRQRIEYCWNKEVMALGSGILGSIENLLRNKNSNSRLALDYMQQEYERTAETCAKFFALANTCHNAPRSVQESFARAEAEARRLFQTVGEVLRKDTATPEELTNAERDLHRLSEELQHIWLNAGPDSSERILTLLLGIRAWESAAGKRSPGQESDTRRDRERERKAYEDGTKPFPKERLEALLKNGESALAQIERAPGNAPLPPLADALETLLAALREADYITGAIGISGKTERSMQSFSFYMKRYELEKKMQESGAYWKLREQVLLAKCWRTVSEGSASPMIRSELKPEEFPAATIEKVRAYAERLISEGPKSAVSLTAEQEIERLREYRDRLTRFSDFLSSTFSSIGLKEHQVVLDLPSDVRYRAEGQVRAVEQVLKFSEKAPKDFALLHETAQAAEQAIRSNLSGPYRISSFLNAYGKGSGYITFSIKGEGAAGEPHVFAMYFPREKEVLSFRPISVPMRLKPASVPLTPQAFAAEVQREMQNVPAPLLAYGGTIGISQDEAKLRTLCENSDRMDYFQNIAEGSWNERFQRAAGLLQRLRAQQTEHSLTFQPFTKEAQSALELLLTLSDQPYADHILAAVADGTMNLGYPDNGTTRQRMNFDLRRDHGMLIQVNRSVENALRSGRIGDWESMRSFIRGEWNRLRGKQWESFAKSEEIGEEGKPKRINVLRLTVEEFKKPKEVEQTAKTLNQALHRGAALVNAGEGRELVTEKYVNLGDFYADVQRNLRELSGPDTHVIVEIAMHGSASRLGDPGRIYLSFAGKTEVSYSAELLAQIDAATTARTVYLWSCHGGSHLKQFRRGIGASYAPRNTVAFGDNKIVRGSSLRSVVSYATDLQPDGFRRGDLNRDGIVTQNEIKELLDAVSRDHAYSLDDDDPIIFDAESNQIGGTVRPRSDEQIA